YVTITVDGPMVSEPYIDMTIAMIRQWGGEVQQTGTGGYFIPAGLIIDNPMSYQIEPDATAASYFFGAAAVASGRVTVAGVSRGDLQGDTRFADALERMGCSVECGGGLTIHARTLRGIDVDMNGISDTVMTLAAVA